MGHGLQPARSAGDVIGPQGGDRMEVPPTGAGRVEQYQQQLPSAATAPAALEADRRGQQLGQPEEPSQPRPHAEPGQWSSQTPQARVGGLVGGRGQGGLQKN